MHRSDEHRPALAPDGATLLALWQRCAVARVLPARALAPDRLEAPMIAIVDRVTRAIGGAADVEIDAAARAYAEARRDDGYEVEQVADEASCLLEVTLAAVGSGSRQGWLARLIVGRAIDVIWSTLDATSDPPSTRRWMNRGARAPSTSEESRRS